MIKVSVTYEYVLLDDDLENKTQTKEDEDDQNFNQIEKAVFFGKIINNYEFVDLMTNNYEDD